MSVSSSEIPQLWRMRYLSILPVDEGIERVESDYELEEKALLQLLGTNGKS